MITINATGDTTLHTAGKYCAEDILVKVPSGGSGGASVETCEVTITVPYGDGTTFAGATVYRYPPLASSVIYTDTTGNTCEVEYVYKTAASKPSDITTTINTFVNHMIVINPLSMVYPISCDGGVTETLLSEASTAVVFIATSDGSITISES